MKTKLLFLTSFILLAVVSSFAQITTTGVAIQGIARDAASNNAITNTTIGLKFTVYYGITPVNAITPVSANVATDAFGVFSYTLDVSAIENKIMYDNQLMLKIEQTSPSTGVISDEKLNFVPYAVSASNGVPTGSIMPFIGTVAPRGWILCDGRPLPGTATELIALLGSNNAPDLRGMFMRGAGTNSNNLYSANVGPAVKANQTDAIKTHDHVINLTTTPDGSHAHTTGFGNDDYDGDAGSGSSPNSNGLVRDKQGVDNRTLSTTTNGAHTHDVSGNTAITGDVETRPVNYGVNYIIKL